MMAMMQLRFCNLLFTIFKVSLKANQVTSTKTQLPYNYYDLPFCKRKHTKAKAENWGESITGDTATTSPYLVRQL